MFKSFIWGRLSVGSKLNYIIGWLNNVLSGCSTMGIYPNTQRREGSAMDA
jgi:hypothetical protein